jgi:fatty acid desaturase
MQDDYMELRRRVRSAGLMDRQPLYYGSMIAINFALLATSFGIFAVFRSLWVQALNALFLGFVLAQGGFLFHDAGHRQISRHRAVSAFFGIIFGNLFAGVSHAWWVHKHDMHHANPNHNDLDPDIDIPVIAFSPEQAQEKRGFARLIASYQAYLFIPLLFFVTPGQHLASAKFLWNERPRYRWAEIIALCLHPIIYIGLPLYFLGPWSALLVIVISRAFGGFYLATVFAPNHKGMLIVDEDMDIDFVRSQVLTSRNVRAHPIVDFWYGGLNYQIEHHLFPSLPRNKMREVQAVVKAFCQERGISYYETSMLTSYKEILEHLHATSAPLRAQPAQQGQ